MQGSILVTGSAGLIGSSLTELLTKRRLHVIELDSRLPSHHVGLGDVRDKKLLSTLINNCQGIVHLAGVSRVVWGEQNPQLCWDTNVDGTKNILEAAYQAPSQPWVIFASSREVYGQQTIFPVTEEATLSPLNVYARSKLEAEKLVNAYRARGLTTAILRFSSVYGSTQDHTDRVIPAFCRAALLNQTLRIDGFNNIFDFTHVKDTVCGILSAIDKLNNRVNDLPPIHLTTGIGHTLLDVALLIENILNKKLNYTEAAARSYDVHRFYGDTTRGETVLGWQSQVTLKQGLTHLLQQYESLLALN